MISTWVLCSSSVQGLFHCNQWGNLPFLREQRFQPYQRGSSLPNWASVWSRKRCPRLLEAESERALLTRWMRKTPAPDGQEAGTILPLSQGHSLASRILISTGRVFPRRVQPMWSHAGSWDQVGRLVLLSFQTLTTLGAPFPVLSSTPLTLRSSNTFQVLAHLLSLPRTLSWLSSIQRTTTRPSSNVTSSGKLSKKEKVKNKKENTDQAGDSAAWRKRPLAKNSQILVWVRLKKRNVSGLLLVLSSI